MSKRKKIPEKVSVLLWGKAAGRCEYCNKLVMQDSLTKTEFNIGDKAHIISHSEEGPRGSETLPDELINDISNIMLLCDECHELIDKGDLERYTPELLREIKQNHERHIEYVTSLKEDRKSHMLLYGANIGQHSSSVSWKRAIPAMLEEKRFPTEKPAIELSLKNSPFQDKEPEFWAIEEKNLTRQFSEIVKPRLKNGSIEHLSIFALASQPLLIKLGDLLSDINAADVYQLHRETPDWVWQKGPDDFDFLINRPNRIFEKIALNLSLSANITNDRINEILGENVSIWKITIENPNNDFMKSKKQLSLFREKFRFLLNEIKTTHGQENQINIFPAVPVSIAVEIGRVRHPKADLPYIVYDQNNKMDGFVKTIEIK